MESKNIILGGGISGLICLHYIKDSILFEAAMTLARDFLDTSFPKYIHKSTLTAEFCDEIGIVPKFKKFKVGIFFEGKILDFFDKNIESEIRTDIYIRYCGKKYGKYVEDKMNGFLTHKYSEEYIENKVEIINRIHELYEDRIFLDCRVNTINLKTKRIGLNGDLFPKTFNAYYENLVSTIPIDVFVSRSNLDDKIEKKTFEIASFICHNNSLKEYNFIYVVDKNYDFNRIAIDGDNIIFERNERDKDLTDCPNFLNHMKIEHSALSFEKFSFSVCKTLNIENVKFIGRFSTGNYTQKIDEVIADARQTG